MTAADLIKILERLDPETLMLLEDRSELIEVAKVRKPFKVWVSNSGEISDSEPEPGAKPEDEEMGAIIQ